jgi:hypothetical protein
MACRRALDRRALGALMNCVAVDRAFVMFNEADKWHV